MSLPWSQACENNKRPILDVLQRHFLPRSPVPGAPGRCRARVLEIGGGTGQHATFFAAGMPWLYWQSSDIATNVDLFRRLEQAALENLPSPLTLDALDREWSAPCVDYLFSANTLHIMSEEAVRGFFRRLPDVLKKDAIVCIYGPFRYEGEFTSASNASFHEWLQQRDPHSGIRDVGLVDELAGHAGLELIEDNRMPANNQLRVWRGTQRT
jgi:cyclopropane fatty-acyl-phospholipid synthase-like methyltransferase